MKNVFVKIALRLLIALSILSISNLSFATGNASERIKGVADFLIERANDNYLYIFQKKIQDNKRLECYFPTTYDNLSVGGSSGLKRLLTSRDLWKESIQKDLEILAIRSLAREIESAVNLSDQSVKISSKILDGLNHFEISYNNSNYPINAINPKWDPKVIAIINGFTNDISNVLVAMSQFRAYGKGCLDAPKVDFKSFKKEFDAFFHFKENIESWVKHIDDNAKYLTLTSGSWSTICSDIGITTNLCSDKSSAIYQIKQSIQSRMLGLLNEETAEKLRTIKQMTDRVTGNKETIVNNAIRDAVCEKLSIPTERCTDKQATVQAVKNIVYAAGNSGTTTAKTSLVINQELLDKINAIKQVAEAMPVSNEAVTSRVFDALKKIREQWEANLQKEIDDAVGEAKEKLQASLEENKAQLMKVFDKLSKQILFFSSIADADSADEVSSILKNYTLPAVSFFEKREEGNHVMITSYLGLSYNMSEDDNADKSNNGIFAPVGLEYSRGVDWFGGHVGSASVMVAPFDFGHPINLKLNDIEEDVEFDEVVAPSLTFTVGLKDYPLTIGLGYQKGRQLPLSGETEDRAILFFAFDMPLFGLYSD